MRIIFRENQNDSPILFHKTEEGATCFTWWYLGCALDTRPKINLVCSKTTVISTEGSHELLVAKSALNMAVGENNFDRLKANALDWRPESAERIAWAQVFLSLLTQARYAAVCVLPYHLF